MKEYSVVGKSTPKIDALSKATGRAIYTDDLRMPGMLIGKMLRSPLAREDPQYRHLEGGETSWGKGSDYE